MSEFLAFTTLFNAAIFAGVFAIRRSIPIKTPVLIIAFSMSVLFCFLYPLLASYLAFPFVVYVYMLMVMVGAVLLFFIERFYFAPEADNESPDGYVAGRSYTVMETAVSVPSAYPVFKPMPGISLRDKFYLPGEKLALPAGNSFKNPCPESVAGIFPVFPSGHDREATEREYEFSRVIVMADSCESSIDETSMDICEIVSADIALGDNCAKEALPAGITICEGEDGSYVPVATVEYAKPENEEIINELPQAVFSDGVFPDVYQCACTDVTIYLDTERDEIPDEMQGEPQNIPDECLKENIILLENEYNRNMEEVVDKAVEETAATVIQGQFDGFEVGYYTDDSPYDYEREDCSAEVAAAASQSPDAYQTEQPDISPEHSDINSLVGVAFDKKSSGDLSGAVAVFMQVLRLNPAARLAALICIEMSAIYRDIGQTEQAAAVLEMLLARWGAAIDGIMSESIRNSINELKGVKA